VPGDEYDAYLASPPTRVDDPIIWWRDHQTIYAKLAQMAFDLLSVPAMSAECERVDIEMRRVKGTLRGLDPTLLRVKGHEASLTRPVGYPRVP
jgi:hypothetical protein